MKLNKTEKDLLRFLQKYPNRWHAIGRDARTVRAVGGLLVFNGLGVRGFEVSKATWQMRLDGHAFGTVKV